MSGGAFDYRDNVLFDLKDMLAREIGQLCSKRPTYIRLYESYVCVAWCIWQGNALVGLLSQW